MNIILIITICLLVIVTIILIWGGVTHWKFIHKKKEYYNLLNNIKLVINSYEPWEITRKKCLESLINDTDFNNFNNIILVLGGSKNESEPKLDYLNKYIKIDSDIKMIVIKLKTNHFDCGGLVALNKYKTHPLIQSNYYINILDTTTFNNDFSERINNFPLRKDLKGVIYSVEKPCSCIFIFDKYFIDLYKNNFDAITSKQAALNIELGNYHKNIKSYYIIGTHIIYGKRENVGEIHLYNSSDKRIIFNYPEYGIKKYIKWGSVDNNKWKKP